MLNLNEFKNEVHQNAVDHGWWEEDRSLGEVLALIHSEFSEALEEYRAGCPAVWHTDDGKPEGIAVELADAFIRIFDYLGELDIRINITSDLNLLAKDHQAIQSGLDFSFPEFISILHYEVATVAKGEKFKMLGTALMGVAILIFYEITQLGVDAEAVLLEKHEYNKSRPYRHGGKRC